MSTYRVGDIVRVVSLPPLEGQPTETVAALSFALGRSFEVRGFGPYGHVELLLGPEADPLLGGFMNSIWLEPEHVDLAPPP